MLASIEDCGSADSSDNSFVFLVGDFYYGIPQTRKLWLHNTDTSDATVKIRLNNKMGEISLDPSSSSDVPTKLDDELLCSKYFDVLLENESEDASLFPSSFSADAVTKKSIPIDCASEIPENGNPKTKKEEKKPPAKLKLRRETSEFVQGNWNLQAKNKLFDEMFKISSLSGANATSSGAAKSGSKSNNGVLSMRMVSAYLYGAAPCSNKFYDTIHEDGDDRDERRRMFPHRRTISSRNGDGGGSDVIGPASGAPFGCGVPCINTSFKFKDRDDKFYVADPISPKEKGFIPRKNLSLARTSSEDGRDGGAAQNPSGSVAVQLPEERILEKDMVIAGGEKVCVLLQYCPCTAEISGSGSAVSSEGQGNLEHIEFDCTEFKLDITWECAQKDAEADVLSSQDAEDDMLASITNYSIVCRARSCLSKISVEPARTINIGECSIGELRHTSISVCNHSPLPALIFPKVSSESLLVVESEVLLGPYERAWVHLEYVARVVNTNYTRNVYLLNAYNLKSTCCVQLRAHNVDTHQILLHKIFYKIFFPNKSDMQIVMDNCICDLPNVRIFSIRNMHDEPLVLELLSTDASVKICWINKTDPRLSDKATVPAVQSPVGDLPAGGTTSIVEASPTAKKNPTEYSMRKTQFIEDMKWRNDSKADRDNRDEESSTKGSSNSRMRKGMSIGGGSHSRALAMRSQGDVGTPSKQLSEYSGSSGDLFFQDNSNSLFEKKNTLSMRRTSYNKDSGSKNNERSSTAEDVETRKDNAISGSSSGTFDEKKNGIVENIKAPVTVKQIKDLLHIMDDNSFPLTVWETNQAEEELKRRNKQPQRVGIKDVFVSAAASDPSKGSAEEQQQRETVEKVRFIQSTYKQFEEYSSYMVPLNYDSHPGGVCIPVNSTYQFAVVMEPLSSSSTRPTDITDVVAEDSPIKGDASPTPSTMESDFFQQSQMQFINLRLLSINSIDFDNHLRKLNHSKSNVSAGYNPLVMQEEPLIVPNSPVATPTSLSIRHIPIRAHIVRSMMKITQKNINFGRIIVGKTATKSVTIYNKARIPLLYSISKSGSISSGFLQVTTGRKGEIPGLSSKTLEFVFKPTLPGVFEETLYVENILNKNNSQTIIIKAKVFKTDSFSLFPLEIAKNAMRLRSTSYDEDESLGIPVQSFAEKLLRQYLSTVTITESFPISCQFAGSTVLNDANDSKAKIRFRVRNMTSTKVRHFTIDTMPSTFLELLCGDSNEEVGGTGDDEGKSTASKAYVSATVEPVLVARPYELHCVFKQDIARSTTNNVMSEEDRQIATDKQEHFQQKLKIAHRKNKADKIAKYTKKLADINALLSGNCGDISALADSDDEKDKEKKKGDKVDKESAVKKESSSDKLAASTALATGAKQTVKADRFCFSLPPDSESNITITVGVLSDKSCAIQEGNLAFVGTFRLYESNNEDTIKHIQFGVMVDMGGPRNTCVDMPLPYSANIDLDASFASYLSDSMISLEVDGILNTNMADNLVDEWNALSPAKGSLTPGTGRAVSSTSTPMEHIFPSDRSGNLMGLTTGIRKVILKAADEFAIHIPATYTKPSKFTGKEEYIRPDALQVHSMAVHLKPSVVSRVNNGNTVDSIGSAALTYQDYLFGQLSITRLLDKIDSLPVEISLSLDFTDFTAQVTSSSSYIMGDKRQQELFVIKEVGRSTAPVHSEQLFTDSEPLVMHKFDDPVEASGRHTGVKSLNVQFKETVDYLIQCRHPLPSHEMNSVKMCTVGVTLSYDKISLGSDKSGLLFSTVPLFVPIVYHPSGHVSMINVEKNVKFGDIPCHSKRGMVLKVVNASVETLHFTASVITEDSRVLCGEFRIMSDISGVLDPLDACDIHLECTGRCVGRLEQYVCISNTMRRDEKRVKLSANITVDQSLYVSFPDLAASPCTSMSSFNEDPNSAGNNSNIVTNNFLDFGVMQLPSHYFMKNTAGSVSSSKLLSMSKKVLPLRIENISGKDMIVTAISNMKSQCAVYSDAGCTVELVDALLPSELLTTTVYVVLRPTTNAPNEEGGKKTEKSVGLATSSSMLSERRSSSNTGKDVCKTLNGGIRFIFFQSDDATSTSAEVSAGEKRHTLKLFETPISFGAVLALPPLPTIKLKYSCLRCFLPSNGSSICKGYSVGSMSVTNSSISYPVKYQLSHLNSTELTLTKACQSLAPSKSCLIFLNDGDNGTLQPLERKVVHFVVLYQCMLSESYLGVYEISIKNVQSGDATSFHQRIFYDCQSIVMSPSPLVSVAAQAAQAAVLSPMSSPIKGAVGPDILADECLHIVSANYESLLHQAGYNVGSSIDTMAIKCVDTMWVNKIQMMDSNADVLPIHPGVGVGNKAVDKSSNMNVVGSLKRYLCSYQITNQSKTKALTIIPISDLPVHVTLSLASDFPRASNSIGEIGFKESRSSATSLSSLKRRDKRPHISLLEIPESLSSRGLIRCGDPISVPAGVSICVRISSKIGGKLMFPSLTIKPSSESFGSTSGSLLFPSTKHFKKFSSLIHDGNVATVTGMVAFVSAAQSLQSFFDQPSGATQKKSPSPAPVGFESASGSSRCSPVALPRPLEQYVDILPIATCSRLTCRFVQSKLRLLSQNIVVLGSVRCDRVVKFSIELENSCDEEIPFRIENLPPNISYTFVVSGTEAESNKVIFEQRQQTRDNWIQNFQHTTSKRMASTATAFFSILAQQESNARNNTSSCDSYEKLETPTLNLQEEEKRADNVPACSEIWFVRGRSTAIVEISIVVKESAVADILSNKKNKSNSVSYNLLIQNLCGYLMHKGDQVDEPGIELIVEMDVQPASALDVFHTAGNKLASICTGRSHILMGNSLTVPETATAVKPKSSLSDATTGVTATVDGQGQLDEPSSINASRRAGLSSSSKQDSSNSRADNSRYTHVDVKNQLQIENIRVTAVMSVNETLSTLIDIKLLLHGISVTDQIIDLSPGETSQVKIMCKARTFGRINDYSAFQSYGTSSESGLLKRSNGSSSSSSSGNLLGLADNAPVISKNSSNGVGVEKDRNKVQGRQIGPILFGTLKLLPVSVELSPEGNWPPGPRRHHESVNGESAVEERPVQPSLSSNSIVDNKDVVLVDIVGYITPGPIITITSVFDPNVTVNHLTFNALDVDCGTDKDIRDPTFRNLLEIGNLCQSVRLSNFSSNESSCCTISSNCYRRAGLKLLCNTHEASSLNDDSVTELAELGHYDTISATVCDDKYNSALSEIQVAPRDSVQVGVRLCPGNVEDSILWSVVTGNNASKVGASSKQGAVELLRVPLEFWDHAYPLHPPFIVSVSLQTLSSSLPVFHKTVSLPPSLLDSYKLSNSLAHQVNGSEHAKGVPPLLVLNRGLLSLVVHRSADRISSVNLASPPFAHQSSTSHLDTFSLAAKKPGEIYLGQQNQSESQLEWLITLGCSNWNDGKVPYRVHTMNTTMDEKWLTLSQSGGVLSTDKATSTLSSSIMLYFNRSKVGYYFSYLVVENLINVSDILVIRVSMEVIQSREYKTEKALPGLFQVYTQHQALVKLFGNTPKTNAVHHEKDVTSGKRISDDSEEAADKKRRNHLKNGLVMDFREVLNRRVYRRRSMILENATDEAIDLELSSTFPRKTLLFSFSPLSSRFYTTVTLPAKGRREVWWVFSPSTASNNPLVGDTIGTVFISCRLTDYVEKITVKALHTAPELSLSMCQLPMAEFELVPNINNPTKFFALNSSSDNNNASGVDNLLCFALSQYYLYFSHGLLFPKLVSDTNKNDGSSELSSHVRKPITTDLFDISYRIEIGLDYDVSTEKLDLAFSSVGGSMQPIVSVSELRPEAGKGDYADSGENRAQSTDDDRAVWFRRGQFLCIRNVSAVNHNQFCIHRYSNHYGLLEVVSANCNGPSPQPAASSAVGAGSESLGREMESMFMTVTIAPDSVAWLFIYPSFPIELTRRNLESKRPSSPSADVANGLEDDVSYSEGENHDDSRDTRDLSSGAVYLHEEYFTLYNRCTPSEKYRVPVRLVEVSAKKVMNSQINSSSSVVNSTDLEQSIVSAIPRSVDSLDSQSFCRLEKSIMTYIRWNAAVWNDISSIFAPVSDIPTTKQQRKQLKSLAIQMAISKIETCECISISQDCVSLNRSLLHHDGDVQVETALIEEKVFKAAKQLADLCFHLHLLTDQLALRTIRQGFRGFLSYAKLSHKSSDKPCARLAQLLFITVFTQDGLLDLIQSEVSASSQYKQEGKLITKLLIPFARQLIGFLHFYPDLGESMTPLLIIYEKLRTQYHF